MPRKYTEEERASAFWEKVDRSGGPDACWPWLRRRGGSGHGQTEWGGRRTGAHRVAWFLSTGAWPDPETPFVLHAPVICHNPACCNPAHLRLGTHRDNVKDRWLDGTMPGPLETHCPHGHEFTPRNTYHGRGGRQCRECKRDYFRSYRAANLERERERERERWRRKRRAEAV